MGGGSPSAHYVALFLLECYTVTKINITNMNYLRTTSFVLGAFFAFSAAASAATPVSQAFPEGIVVTPLDSSRDARLIHKDVLYSSDRPDVAAPWVEEDGDFSRGGGISNGTYVSSAGVAVGFEGYDYFIVHGEVDPNGVSFDPKRVEVWRVSHQDPSEITMSLGLSTNYSESSSDNAYREGRRLFVFKNGLYLFMTNGELWKTKDGESWFQVQTDGLNGSEWGIYESAVVGTYVYTVESNKLYRSTRGTTWKKVKTSFGKSARVVGIAEYDDSLYVITHKNNRSVVWKKTGKASWSKLKTFKKLDEVFSVAADNNGLYVAMIQRVVRYNGSSFENVHSANSEITLRGLFTVRGKTLLDLYTSNGDKLFRVSQ